MHILIGEKKILSAFPNTKGNILGLPLENRVLGDIFKVFKICTKLIHILVKSNTFTNGNHVLPPSHGWSSWPWWASSLTSRRTTTRVPWRPISVFLSWCSPARVVQSRGQRSSLWLRRISRSVCELTCRPTNDNRRCTFKMIFSDSSEKPHFLKGRFWRPQGGIFSISEMWQPCKTAPPAGYSRGWASTSSLSPPKSQARSFLYLPWVSSLPNSIPDNFLLLSILTESAWPYS